MKHILEQVVHKHGTESSTIKIKLRLKLERNQLSKETLLTSPGGHVFHVPGCCVVRPCFFSCLRAGKSDASLCSSELYHFWPPSFCPAVPLLKVLGLLCFPVYKLSKPTHCCPCMKPAAGQQIISFPFTELVASLSRVSPQLW